MIALNIGSGQRPFKPPWWNYDVQEGKWKLFTEEFGCIWQDINYLEHYCPGKLDFVCLHHVLEHFGCNEGDSLIQQCHDLLKPSGYLLIFVPNIQALARRYAAHMLDDYTFNVNMYGAYMGDEADRHKWGYSFQSLAEYLSKWKWTKVDLFDWRDIKGANIAKDWWILGMEAVK